MELTDKWVQWWQAVLLVCGRLGGAVHGLQVDPPASESEIKEVEQALGLQIPRSFRKVLRSFSGRVDFSWFFPDNFEPPEPFDDIFSGGCSWSLTDLVRLETSRQDWVKQCFPDPDNVYDAVWHNKLSFLEVGDGDVLAIDLRSDDGPVVYLSHAGGEAHGYILGENFIDFIDRWSSLGCPGSEDWQMAPFLDAPTSLLQSDGQNAIRWREILGFSSE